MSRTYEVQVVRIAYGSCKITVNAISIDDAVKEAVNQAGEYEFSEHDADYEIESVREVMSA